jgi:hypothetical protein
VELTVPGEPEGLTAVLLQLAGITQKLSALDERQASDVRDLAGRIAAVAGLVHQLQGTTASHTQALAALDGLDQQVAGLAAHTAHGADQDAAAYQPPATPKLWKLDGPARDAAIGKLRAWVEQVYRPGYGHLALSELWSVLYLAPARTPGTLAGQAEWHTRLLAGAAEQLARETRGCAHHAAGYGTAATGARP